MIDEATLAQMNGQYVVPPDAGPAWREACEYGFDMSLVEAALRITPEERLEAHQHALNMILQLTEDESGGTGSHGSDKNLLLRLKEHEVEFVVIGEVCDMLHGGSPVTEILKICCPFTVKNLRRIETAMKDLHPHHRLAANRLPLELTDELCSRLKNLYLKTDLGNLDCLGKVAGIGGYQEALQRSEISGLSYGGVRMLNLDALIAAKEAVGRPRDLEAVRQLRAIKEKLEQQPKLKFEN